MANRTLADFVPTTLETLSAAVTPPFGYGDPILAIQGLQAPQEERTQGTPSTKQDMLSEAVEVHGNLDLTVQFLRFVTWPDVTLPLEFSFVIPEQVLQTGVGAYPNLTDDGAHQHDLLPHRHVVGDSYPDHNFISELGYIDTEETIVDDGAHHHTVTIPARTINIPDDGYEAPTYIKSGGCSIEPTGESILLIWRNGQFKGRFPTGTVIPFDPETALVQKSIAVFESTESGSSYDYSNENNSQNIPTS